MLTRQKLFQVAEYLQYWLSQVDEHSLQAPFIYDFYTKVILGESPSQPDLIALRQELTRNINIIPIKDYGAGSITGASEHRQIGVIAKYSISTIKTAQLISRITAYFNPGKVIELGTSLGLLTLEINRGTPGADIYTIEGAPALCDLAKSHFKKYSTGQIKLYQGNIDKVLPQVIQEAGHVDVAIVDANHTKEATLSYFYTLLKGCNQQSVIVIDDIHWSKGMKAAWSEISNHPEVTCSIDLYQIGVVMFREELSKQQWTLTV